METEVYQTASDGRTGITGETTLALQTEVEELLKGENCEKIPCTGTPIPEYGTVHISYAYGKNCPNCLPCHAKSTGHC